ncbi:MULTISPECIES: DUF86 domain-containing protein [unclassified Oleiphilus]|nr:MULTISPECIES: DUF86 domain-containing protein [unclassified Oleiphilus]KZY30504.1 hypothetical protein A3729_10655 [Oleiphilus sp. HI0043]KZZ34113.1 hypothetical protein A3757_18355 [Oleiphilus sp. HI0117]KZZ34489.1 hypothetical protein A3756_17775 [Oleiphilus sp. HI0086]KZZ35462.1 hypothetical protein A3756_15560 [Oleiphilus sp. HI0086]KZZ55350.1 hypothetical protein A3761_12020 [Oleiphilus sp. HI0123]
MDDVILNKLATIKRCLQRVREEFTSEAEFKQNYTKQDSVLLNIQRACEASIDIANYLIRVHRLGIPQSARDSFDILAGAKLITVDISGAMKRMVGLRNIAVHDYQTLDLDIVISVIEKHLSDFEGFSAEVISE